MSKEDYHRRILMELLEQNGISLDDLPEPVPPTDEEVQRLVKELLDEGKAQEAAEALRTWPEKTIKELRTAFKDPAYLVTVRGSEPLHIPFSKMVDVLCKSAPDLIVDHLDMLSQIAQVANQCIETAFRHSPKKLEKLFEQYVTSEQSEALSTALLGIRAAAWKDGFTVQREDSLYRNSLRLCAPDYPTRPQPDSISKSDPALFVCQAFGSLAQVDLATMPYFSLDNPHFQEIVCWLPSVVSHATPELVRSEFTRAVDLHDRDANVRDICRYFIPLAAKKLGPECRNGILRMLSSESKKQAESLRGPITKALAIVECGCDPLTSASDAISKGGLGTLSKFQQVVPLLRAFDGEVRNGGIFQFLFNFSGIHASETLESLRLMNDLPGQALLEAGIEAVTSEAESLSPHLATRKLGTTYLRKKFGDTITKLEKAYYQQSDCDLRVYTFVLEHVDQFRVT
jgi:Domain of unknown function (DUF4375)